MQNVAIIGNGVSGITAARHIRKLSDAKITVVSSESQYFFSRTALMYIFMGHMKFEHTQPYENWFWKKNNIDLIFGHVSTIDPQNKVLQLDSGEHLDYDALILALGSKPNPLPVPGTDLKGVQSLYSKQDLELLEKNTTGIDTGVVVGGGLIGVELAEMLHSRGITTKMIIREEKFWNIVLPPEESVMVGKHIESRGVELLFGRTVSSINGIDRVNSMTLDDDKEIPSQFAGITIGVSPNISLVARTEIETDRGILVDEFLQTNIPDIYAIGDCAQLRRFNEYRRSLEPVWYTGRMMGETVAQTITGNPTAYFQGNWFNSAKFFDLEYQTYGYVPSTNQKDFANIVWQNKEKENLLRLIFNPENKLVGVNSLGLRIRHEVADLWIEKGKRQDEVLDNIEELNFDPEFYRHFKLLVKEEYTV